ncbi:UNVERIFIED_CONTAM: Granulin [Trichonephila clavipes]
MMELLVALALLSFIAGVFGDCSDVCKHSETCCPTPEGWKCCPFANGVCCPNEKHCCPSDKVCDRLGGCYHKMKPLLAHIIMKRQGAFQDDPESSEVQCDEKHSCSLGNTCCESPDGTYGCCKYRNAQCCKDGLHCCPKYSTCSGHECIVHLPNSPLRYGIPTRPLEKSWIEIGSFRLK